MKSILQLSILLLFISGCTKSPVYQSQSRLYSSIISNGLERNYLLVLPDSYDNNHNFPLVIALHGAGGKASQMEKHYNLTQKANAENYVIVYPEGTQSDGVLGLRYWNAGGCCKDAADNKTDDVKFIQELIEKIISRYHINRKRIYITGMSNGAMMAYRLACELPGKIAAIAPVAGTMYTEGNCPATTPVPILHIHSEKDTRVPYNGGTGVGGIYFPPVEEGIAKWIKINDCKESSRTETQFSNYKTIEWSGCQKPVKIYLTEDGGHSWPGGNPHSRFADPPATSVNANELIWSFFKQHELD
ncbi:extracellular catalytic domain type 1 short-chain-length polyhydroxyalkanoate depolymerase [Abyssalbus ytuae]|uniref:Alpha/beta hydrolase-fold protein n=1 Tax=Abyssalbus ytuae TaxID=2926907 RepID=A0A9E6ZJP1_9FLAO|nr:PHB depolymerase family esterase [Abyssalbus ytuae]UOB16832.1 alpha/beta hydrolase-fold protein [Abyssalbus ytuae]